MHEQVLKGLPPEQVERYLIDLGADTYQLYKTLSEPERALLLTEVAKVIAGDTSALDALYAYDFDTRPVDPYTFFTHTDYLGHVQNGLFPAWMPHLMKVCDPTQNVSEVILAGAIGTGKSTVADLILAFAIYWLSTMHAPAAYYGLDPNSKITFGIYTLLKESAEDDNYDKMIEQVLKPSPYFSEVFKPKFLKDHVEFPKRLNLITGSNTLHQIGKTLFGLLVDEMNFMAQGNASLGKAHQLANNVTRRLESRFIGRGGVIPGKCIFISSKRTKADFLEKRIAERKHNKHVHIVDGPLWEFSDKIPYLFKREPQNPNAWFRVMIGDQSTDSAILDEVAEDPMTGDPLVTPLAAPTTENRNKNVVIFVPVEHYSTFKIELDGALRDFASIATDSLLPFIRNKADVTRAIDPTLPRPVAKDIVSLHVRDYRDLKFEDVFNRASAMGVYNGRWVPRRHPRAPRYIHIDLAATRDRAGFAMVHPSTHIYGKDHTGQVVLRKSAEVDFAVAIAAGPLREEIDFGKIIQGIVWLREQGYEVRKVTFDSWQSKYAIQQLRIAGFTVEIQSVDTTINPYATTREALAEGRLLYPPNELLVFEFQNLEQNPTTGKVDHKPGGTKDVADAVTGATFGCLTDEITPDKYEAASSIAELPQRKEHGKFLSQLRVISGRTET